MAYVLQGRGVCYLHIPKTSGTWVKRVLGGIEHGVNDGSLTHDLPSRWDYETVFTVVREPAEWLGSVWAHRIRNRWDDYPQKIPWQRFIQFTDRYKSNKFPEWIENITKNIPGVVSWFYNFYTPPGVIVIRKEYDLYEWLYGLGCRPWEHPPLNMGPNSPIITDEIRGKVREAEVEAYRRYGY